jgi:methionyl aminopeptidase
MISEKDRVLKMKQGGRILSEVMTQAIRFVKTGLALEQIDNFIEALIEKKGARPSFKRVPGYRWASCINLNEGIVHGIPDKKRVKRGDVISLDIGVFYQGYHTDMSYTWEVETNNFREFLLAGEKALTEAVAEAKIGNRIGDISLAIQRNIETEGIGNCSRDLTGHGVGAKLHQAPIIPCFLDGEKRETPLLKENQALAIEVIYSQGTPKIEVADDGWTIATVDGKISALFEKTVLVAKNGGFELTPYLWEKDVQSETTR